MRADFVASYVEHLEQIPTSELSSVEVKRLSRLVLKVESADLVSLQPTQELKSAPATPPAPAKQRRSPRRRTTTDSLVPK